MPPIATPVLTPPRRAPHLRGGSILAILFALAAAGSTACASSAPERRPADKAESHGDSDAPAPHVNAALGRSSQPIFLWRAVHPDHDAQLYLYGSMHMRRAKHGTLPPEVRAVLARADVTLFELDREAATSMAVQAETLERGLMLGPGLDTVVPADTYAAVTLAADRVGTPMLVIDRMRPWLAALTLEVTAAQASALAVEYGVEEMVHAELDARPTPPQRAGLETPSEQLDIFADMSDADAAVFLGATAASIIDPETDRYALGDAYAAGDADALARLVQADRGDDAAIQALFTSLIETRNARMAQRIVPYVQRGGLIVVTVGVAHLINAPAPAAATEERSVIAHLVERGFIVERIAPETGATASSTSPTGRPTPSLVH